MREKIEKESNRFDKGYNRKCGGGGKGIAKMKEVRLGSERVKIRERGLRVKGWGTARLRVRVVKERIKKRYPWKM